MSLSLSRSGEELGDFFIGHFSDTRLSRVGALFFKRINELLTVCIKSLAPDRAAEVAFHRFLNNDKVTTQEMSEELSKKTNEVSSGKTHVLCLQDTVQLTYPTQANKKASFGPSGHSDTKGLFVHPGVIVDASNRDILGLSSIISWSREEENEDKSDRPIEEKESIRWLNTAELAKERVSNAGMLTVVGDRESDIFEFFSRVPDEKTQVIVRASHDRNLATNEKISEHLLGVNSVGTHLINLPAMTGKRKKRTATLEIKYSSITLQKSGYDNVDIFTVSAVEKNPPGNEKAISWILLTTHKMKSLDDAIQILTWYTWRWIIEQIFRTMKNKGLKIEDSQVETPEKLEKMAVMSIATAIKVMSLVESRDSQTDRKASDIFTDLEIMLLEKICKKMEGKTQRQKNKFNQNSLAWASWIIARLGGWKGYASESPPGPITILRGLQKFEMQYEGWVLAREDVCIG